MNTEVELSMKWIVILAVAAGALFFFWNSFDWVDAGEIGVGVNFGKITGTYDPGFQYTGLFTQIYPYNLRIRSAQIQLTEGAQAAPTREGQSVLAKISVNYRLAPTKENIMSIYQQVGTDTGNELPDRLNIENIVREGFKQVTVKYDALEILSKREEIKQQAIGNIQANFPKYFLIDNVIITDIGFAPDYQAVLEKTQVADKAIEFERKQVEVVQQQQAQAIAKAQADANMTIIAATAAKEQAILDAEGKAAAVRLAGEAAGASLRAQRLEINTLLVQKAAIDKWNGQYPSYLMMPSSGSNFLIQLPSANTTAGG